MSRENCISDAGSLHRYRTEIPNLVLDMLADGKIDQHDLALYVVLKRTAGDTGACWKTSTALASETGVSAGHLVKSKAKLRDLGLIEIKATIRNGSIAHDITIADVWAENMSRFAPEPARSSGESARSSGERLKGEEEPFKKNQKTRGSAAPKPASRVTATTEPVAQSGATAPEPPSPTDRWIDVKARISEMFGGLTVTDKSGTLKPHVGVTIGILGKAAGDDPVQALALLDEYASSPDRRFCNAMYRLPESVGSWLGKRGTAAATGRSVSAVSTYGSNPDDPSGIKAYLARQNAGGRP